MVAIRESGSGRTNGLSAATHELYVAMGCPSSEHMNSTPPTTTFNSIPVPLAMALLTSTSVNMFIFAYVISLILAGAGLLPDMDADVASPK